MNDIWKIWRAVFPAEGVIGGFLIVIIGSFAIHMMVMLASDRYVTGLLG
ncbi:MAG: hypothetical protein AAGF44_05675 [Pseudomonadota bacterium]